MDEQRYGEIRIVELPPLRVACHRAFSTEPEQDASERLARWRDEHGLTGPFRHFGFDTDVPGDLAGEGVRGYEVWTTVPPDAEASADVAVRDFPGGAYAAMSVRDPFDDPFAWIPSGWERLRAWLETRDDLAPGEHQWLEELVGGGPRRDLILYHPVRVRVLEAGSV